MNEFINNILNSNNVKVAGMYKGMKFAGLVTDIRAKYGKDIQVTVEDALHSTLYKGGDNLYENLEVQLTA